MIGENEFFTKVMETYSEIINDPEKMELLQSNSIRELTEIFAKTGDYEFFQRAMPTILSLFNDKCEDPFDTYSRNLEKLNENEKCILNGILKENV
ncbi:MAG: hypothetical protein KGD63_04255 [Candidatus Lokiarchaeota archaeon]|nr:hypothetical protein [Candidatus Lokiarchaeota archaeon]